MTLLRKLFAASFGLIVLALPASAQEKPARQEFSVQCASQGQKCDKSVKVRFPADGGNWNLALTVPEQQCSDIQYVISISGASARANGRRRIGSPYLVEVWRTVWLSAGATDSTILTGVASPILYVSAVGREGGCNQGSLVSWGVGVALSGAGQ